MYWSLNIEICNLVLEIWDFFVLQKLLYSWFRIYFDVTLRFDFYFILFGWTLMVQGFYAGVDRISDCPLSVPVCFAIPYLYSVQARGLGDAYPRRNIPFYCTGKSPTTDGNGQDSYPYR